MKRNGFLTLVLAFGLISLAFGQIGVELKQKLDKAAADEIIPVIVAMQETFDVPTVAHEFQVQGDFEAVRTQVIQILKNKAEQAHFGIKKVCDLRSKDVKHFQSFWISNMIAMKATPAVIREVAAQPNVQGIFLDEEQQFVDYLPGEPTRDAWGLDKIGSKEVNKKYRGKNILVAVIDTGVNYNHDDLKDRVIKGKDCYNNDMDPLDDNGHGSHCAGTVAGTTYGVAPEATILAVKVLSGGGSGSWQNVADGVQYVADYNVRGKRVDVASMSLGGRPPIQAVLKTAFDNALALGIRFAIAAGNSGPSAKTIGTPGDLEPIISVGATDINDNIASFSSRGPVDWNGPSYIKPDVSAPGVNITSCWKGTATASNTISGTSMATPHVAGLMALILDAKGSLTAAEVKKLLESTALDLGTAGKDTSFGSGRVRAIEATNGTVAQSRYETEEEVVFEIKPDKTISMNMAKDNPLWWSVKIKVSYTILEPAGTYNGTFIIRKSGKPDQTGEIKDAASGTTYELPTTYTVYTGSNNLIFEGKYTGTSTATTGKIRVKVKSV